MRGEGWGLRGRTGAEECHVGEPPPGPNEVNWAYVAGEQTGARSPRKRNHRENLFIYLLMQPPPLFFLSFLMAYFLLPFFLHPILLLYIWFPPAPLTAQTALLVELYLGGWLLSVWMLGLYTGSSMGSCLNPNDKAPFRKKPPHGRR